MPRKMREEIADFKRSSILKEAIRQFYAKGYDGTRIDEITSALGVTKPFIYYHFKNKTELLDEICVHATAFAKDILESATSNEDSAFDQLKVALRQFALAVIANQASIAICFREEKYISAAARKQIEANRRRYEVRLNELLSRAQKEKAISVSDVQVATQTLTGAITWIFIWYREGGPLGSDKFADRVVELVMSMLNAQQ